MDRGFEDWKVGFTLVAKCSKSHLASWEPLALRQIWLMSSIEPLPQCCRRHLEHQTLEVKDISTIGKARHMSPSDCEAGLPWI